MQLNPKIEYNDPGCKWMKIKSLMFYYVARKWEALKDL